MPESEYDAYTDEVGERAAAVLEAGEDVGDANVLNALRSLTTIIDLRALTKECIDLGAELIKITLGVSDVTPDSRDIRFKDSAWTKNAIYRRLGQTYLAFCKSTNGIVSDAADWRSKERARFALEAMTSTLAPTNTLIGNPAALKKAVSTRGQSLRDGFGHFVADLRNNGGMPSMVDASPYVKGVNTAATPGSVVFRNDVLELIRYHPTTDSVRAVPMLLIPPQINKYYFTDLAPGRSLIEYAVAHGLQMFVVSWRNPGKDQGKWNLDQYVTALLAAVDAMRSLTESDKINAFGFCAGGITLASMLAYMATQHDDRVNAACFAVTLLDWNTPSAVGMMRSETLIKLTKKRSTCVGVVSGRDLGKVFAWFRPNELIWNYWVNNYLMGNKPPSFDILAWNNDTTNLPAGLHTQFLDMFSHNSLAKPNHLKVLGVPLNLGDVVLDTYVLGASNDHLTPWQGCYKATQLFSGDSTFVLSNAGHIASLVNPPGNPKSSYNEGPVTGADCDQWKSQSRLQKGSWWEHWKTWALERAGKEIDAPNDLGNEAFPELEPAPGTYIHG